MKNVLVILMILVLLLVDGLPSQAQSSVYPTETDVPYAGTAEPLQMLDVYLPSGTSERVPAVLVIHGGGFRIGSKSDVRPVAYALTQQGYAVFAVNYRLSPAVTYPAHVEDVFCAAGWIAAHAGRYNLDPERFYVWGGSAGATLALMVGLVDDRALYAGDCPTPLDDAASLAGIVAYYPATDFATLTNADAPTLISYLGGTLDELPTIWAEASPLTWVDGSEPPLMLIHGTRDRTVPFAQSELLATALEQADVEVMFLVLEGADHGFMNRIRGAEGSEALTAALTFLDDLAAPDR